MCRGNVPPASFLSLILFLAISFSFSPNHKIQAPVYLTLGPEAPAILRALIGEQRFITVQPGQLADTLHEYTASALIVSEDWSASDDLDTARSAGLQIVTLKRHNSIANIEANIRTLAALTGNESAGARWIASFDEGLAKIKRSVQKDLPVRVLVLSPEAYTQGQGALITELIEIAGGSNVAAEAAIPEAREVEDEQIRQLKPDVVLLINWRREPALTFAQNPLYRGIVAFDQRRIYRIAAPGKDPARLVQDVQRLADLIHPQIF